MIGDAAGRQVADIICEGRANRDGQIATVFSVCAGRDIDVWSVASKYIRRYIDAENYVVIVPDREVEQFRLRTESSFQVLPESACFGRYEQQIRQMMAAGASERLGWYLQQLIKISYLETAGDDEVFLIWDADTVPLKPLNFVNDDGALRYYQGDEFHRPYFASISKLLGMEKKVNYSFIAQCFPIKGSWAKEFFSYIDARHRRTWMEALIDSVDFREACGFSEYETLGTYLSYVHPAEMHLAPGSWERCGRSLTGDVHYLEWWPFNRQLKRDDFVSYERWDKPFEAFPGLIRRILRLLLIRGRST
jgi:hypothetical protein